MPGRTKAQGAQVERKSTEHGASEREPGVLQTLYVPIPDAEIVFEALMAVQTRRPKIVQARARLRELLMRARTPQTLTRPRIVRKRVQATASVQTPAPKRRVRRAS